MIILKTNLELKLTFERLIKTMQVPVEWNGYFVVVGDYLILQGRVRSLFFNLENRKVVTNLIDIPIREEEVVEIENNAKVQNVLNLLLYAFGKWGAIHGLKVEKDYAQLNTLFTGILREFSVEPGYNRENFRFYKEGIRINYEDVIQYAIEAEENGIEEEQKEEESSAGLWHKLVWEKMTAPFLKTETTFEQRQKNRLGKNFYMVGYQCPKCRENLHMAVFPEEKPFRIETSEGGVLLARVYTCKNCNCFYTPRPEKLLAEGDIYVMDFMNDVHACEDYLELLGENGDRVSNYKYNEFEDMRNRRENRKQQQPEEESLETICESIGDLADAELAEVQEKMEEGFYPVQSVRELETVIKREYRRRKGGRAAGSAGRSGVKPLAFEKKIKENEQTSCQTDNSSESKDQAAVSQTGFQAMAPEHTRQSQEQEKIQPPVSEVRREATRKRYEAKFNVLNRLSPAQVTELKGQLIQEKELHEKDREEFLNRIHKKEIQQKRERVQKLAEGCKGQSYIKIQRVIEEIEKEELPQEEKEVLLEPLYIQKRAQAESEARQIIEKMPQNLNLQQYQAYADKLKDYQELDITPYEPILDEKRKQAESREISNIIRHARTSCRQDLTDLTQRLKKQNFDEELLRPYLSKIEEKIRKTDEDAIAEICGNPVQMTPREIMEAYEKIENGVFLPELKTNALEMLTKRLVKIKTDECELLVRKLEDSIQGKIKENPRYHFYPARRVMMQEAEPEETEVIQFALDTYGTKRGNFEYPIVVIDTSRNRSGKEGMILTPEHLFYRTLLNAFAVSVADIHRVWAQTGLLNGGLFLELRDGTRIKIPYAVERQELRAWGECLDEFVHYLQEKPDSRNVTYLAKEKHELICCFRCGYTYKGGQICPKCGYKMNQ